MHNTTSDRFKGRPEFGVELEVVASPLIKYLAYLLSPNYTKVGR